MPVRDNLNVSAWDVADRNVTRHHHHMADAYYELALKKRVMRSWKTSRDRIRVRTILEPAWHELTYVLRT